ncbi:MAG TPA: glycoside hydrolase family 15 protein, partial [Steroidobacteraceae bacterium]|nr:glycoside hydrolase family 15 protein [Steroidobacteraceae bacterium]
MSTLEEWIAAEARYATQTMLGAISATRLLMERPGFGQRVIPRPGSILASPVPAHYDPDPDYFFHWFRDAAIVIEALRVALIAGYADRSALERLREFARFSHALHSLSGQQFLRHSDFRIRTRPDFLQYLRP